MTFLLVLSHSKPKIFEYEGSKKDVCNFIKEFEKKYPELELKFCETIKNG